ncbi:hypothetical protein VTN00DRAFT_4625 [Thermoascus crustaceus]|uniref:uncharacterized protein n=1 Tax=Thermoascus crustaceus TaxID=5088 RepID=UPI0037429DEA
MDNSKTIHQEFNGRNHASGVQSASISLGLAKPHSADNVQNHETQRTTEKPIGAERRKPHKPPIIDNTEYSLQLRKQPDV